LADTAVRHLSRPEDQIMASENKPHATGEDVQPFVAFVRLRDRLGPGGGDDDLPCLRAAGLSRQWDHGPVVGALWLQVDTGVSDVGSADQLVQRHVVGLREREE
jgi:hypothetical protein